MWVREGAWGKERKRGVGEEGGGMREGEGEGVGEEGGRGNKQ